MLVLEGNDYAHDFINLRDFPDRNVMFEFHEYAIFNRAWRAPNSRALAPFLALRAATGRPLWLGEFGEKHASVADDDGAADEGERYRLGRLAVEAHRNLRLAEPDAVGAIAVNHLDGLVSWERRRDGRRVGDMWF
jgi:hypothetical protein